MEMHLTAALKALNIPYEKGTDGWHLTLRAAERTIPADMHVSGDRITLYVLIRQNEDAQAAAIWCNERNRTLGDGCMVAAADGRIYLKLTAYLMDGLYAQESLQRALGRLKELVRQNAER